MAALAAAPALATDRYVDSGASCPGSGTSGSPYCSFSSINSLDLAPGDRVLLKRGATFNVSTGPSLILGDEDDGSSVSWNSVEPYGSGADPIISGASAAETIGILGTNLDYWKFIEIEFKLSSVGINAEYTTLTHTGLRFDKLYFHDLLDTNPWSGNGIGIYSTATNHALTATTSASSTDTANGYCVCRINDRKIADFNGWSNSQALPQWVELDFGSSKTVDKVGFTTTTGYITQGFQIQHWNGSSWVTDATIANNTEKSRTITFTPVSTQKIRAYITTGDQNGTARVDELSAYDWTSVPAPSVSQWVAKDIQITDTEFGPAGLYLGIDGINSVKLETFQEIVFLRNYVHDIKWDMAFRYVKNVKWIDNRNTNIASGYLAGGNTDLHLWAVQDSTFVNSLFDYTYDASTYDQTFGDLAYRMDDTRFRNNLIEDAAGPGLEWHVWRVDDDYGLDATDNYFTDQEISGNVFRNNGWDTTPISPNNYEAGLSFPGSGNNNCNTLPTGTVSNNLYWEPTGFYSPNGCFASSLTFTNNLSIGTSAEIYHAGQTFSDAGCSTSPWSYQSSTDGSSWTAMSTLDTVNPKTDVRCKPSGSSTPWVNRFEQFPSAQSSYSVARTWTAPSSGTIAIRSRALKAETGGDGVTVRVTKNGSAIISATALGASDQIGVVMNADSISVTTGDLIRFEVSDGANTTNDRVSWSPAVAYTSKTYLYSAGFSSTQGANQWSYQYAASGAYSYTNMANWDGTNSWWEEATSQPPHTIVGNGWLHPGSSNDSVLTWTAPAAGSITITNSGGNVRLNQAPADGTTASILKNTSSSTYWSANILDQTGVSMGTVGPITVASGDQIHFRINKRSNDTSDATLWNPNVVFTPDDGSVTYIASARWEPSLIQGPGQWKFKYAAIGAYSYTDMAYSDATNAWWEEATSQPPWTIVGNGWQHPGSANDSVRTWTAPGAGSVTITNNGGNVRLSGSTSDGTAASILKNTSSTTYWSANITDTTGVDMGSVTISVASADQIHFRINKRTNESGDSTLWDPKVVFTPSGW